MDEPEKYTQEKQPDMDADNAPAPAVKSGGTERLAKAEEYVCVSVEEQDRAYEIENSDLREKLRKAEDIFLKFKHLNERKDEYIRALQRNAQMYAQERKAAAHEIERLKNEVEELRRKIKEDAPAKAGQIASAGGSEITDKKEAETAVEPQAEKTEETKEKKPRSRAARAWKTAGEVVFYILLVLMVATAVLVKAASNGSPVSIAGFSAMVVVSESMQSEIPKGSLVITKAVDTDTLEIGDDITYMANQTTSITHRIVGIMEDYEGTGERAFITQGVMNSAADTEPVVSANIVGKVVFHSEVLGIILGFVSSYWPVILVAAVAIIFLVHALRRILREPA